MLHKTYSWLTFNSNNRHTPCRRTGVPKYRCCVVIKIFPSMVSWWFQKRYSCFNSIPDVTARVLLIKGAIIIVGAHCSLLHTVTTKRSFNANKGDLLLHNKPSVVYHSNTKFNTYHVTGISVADDRFEMSQMF